MPTWMILLSDIVFAGCPVAIVVLAVMMLREKISKKAFWWMTSILTLIFVVTLLAQYHIMY